MNKLLKQILVDLDLLILLTKELQEELNLMKQQNNPLAIFAEDIINGVGGLKDLEYYEMATPMGDRDISIVIWTLKCLADPTNELSQIVLDEIIDRRLNLLSEKTQELNASVQENDAIKLDKKD